MNRLDIKMKWIWAVIIFAPSIILYFIFILPFVLEGGVSFTLAFLVGLIISFVIAYLIAHLQYINWGYSVKDNSVEIEKGILWKKRVTIPFRNIQNVDIHENPFERILTLASVQIHTAGTGASNIGEGQIPGLDKSVAESLKNDLINKTK